MNIFKFAVRIIIFGVFKREGKFKKRDRRGKYLNKIFSFRKYMVWFLLAKRYYTGER